MAGKLVVRPITRTEAKKWCEDHPHASSVPNSAKYYMAGYLNGKRCGLAVWGYGIVPRQTPTHLFGENGDIKDYLELCRFFVYDWCPKNTASRFLATTHRIIKKYRPEIKWLYTYAAGFQGLVGYIYKATGYDYIGKVEAGPFTYIPGKGLIHNISIWHRYGFAPSGSKGLKRVSDIFGCEVKHLTGYNFRYIYWLCSKAEKAWLMTTANFEIQPYPSEDDMAVWTIDGHGNKETVPLSEAKQIPIIKLKTGRQPAVATV